MGNVIKNAFKKSCCLTENRLDNKAIKESTMYMIFRCDAAKVTKIRNTPKYVILDVTV